VLQLMAVPFFAATIPLSAWFADRHGPRAILIGAAVAHHAVRPAVRTAAGFPKFCLRAGLPVIGHGQRWPTVRWGRAGRVVSDAGPVQAPRLHSILPASSADRYAIRRHVAGHPPSLPAVGWFVCVAGAVTVAALLLLGPRAMAGEKRS
jgi:hypothetical protein